MPSASNGQRILIEEWFGDCMDGGPTKLLESHGYTLLRSYNWKRPTPSHTVSEIEWQCITFLADEWDYGGIEDEK